MAQIKFGTDGVRGDAGQWPIDSSGAFQIGYGIGSLLRRQTSSPSVLIGRDTRQSGNEILSSLAQGLSAHDVRLNDAGIMTTAGIAYLTKHHKMDAGIVISASHNPWTENGIKVIGADGCKLSDEHERALEMLVNEPPDHARPTTMAYMQSSPAFARDYSDHLVEPFKTMDMAGIKIVLDCANGAASHIAPQCFQRLGCQTVISHAAPDGRNINHECGSETVRAGRGDLFEIMKAEGAHLGAAFDGDADRVVFLAETGQLVDGDHVLYILATHLAHTGDLASKVVVTTTMANRGLDLALASHQIETIRTPVGDKHIIRKIQDNGYELGGEQSGHIIVYDEDHTTGDGIYTALFICSILASSQRPSLSELAAPLQKLPQVIASAQVPSKPELQSLADFGSERDKISAYLGQGVTIDTRYSGTEPLFRVMIEGTSQHELADLARCAVHLGRVVQTATGGPLGWIEVKDCSTGASLALEDLELTDSW